MLYLDPDGTIRLTRGDTARLTVQIINDVSDADYEIGEHDTLTLSVKKSVNDADPLIQKTIVGSQVFHIEPEDTNELEFGKYKYDVQLTTSGGDIYTVIEPSTFKIMKEVTY